MEPSPTAGTNSYAQRVSVQWQIGVSVPSTPEYYVRKKLFDVDEATEDGEMSQCTSEYFSQSSCENSCVMSDGFNQTNLFDDSPSTKEWDLKFATPNPSPLKRAAVQECSNVTPLIKKQRLFSPTSPIPADKLGATFCSWDHFSFNNSIDSMNCSIDNDDCQVSGDVTNSQGCPVDSDDVMMCSPPCIERLQLFDYPRTPASIARCSGIHVSVGNQSRPRTSKHPTGLNSWKGIKCSSKVTRSGPELRRRPSRGTNINPFTPTDVQGQNRVTAIGVSSECEGLAWASTPLGGKDEVKSHKKLALRESNISRYREEFHEVCVIGTGSFGTVYKCINRLDGCVYALKKSHKPVAGSPDEAAALREVCAHAVLGAHPHLVRYYSAWAEEYHMIIQNEYCNGGNLSSKIAQNQKKGKVFSEDELKQLVRHVALGLQHIHSMGLVHLDIKPDNIFLSFSEPHCPMVISEDPSVDLQEQLGPQQQYGYKIGDMGHVTSISDPQVEEGDCRFLPREILQDNYNHLSKADIFSLGLTTYCAGSLYDLPRNGESWHRIRDGNYLQLDHCSQLFNQLLEQMITGNPAERPSAPQILSRPVICPSTQKSKAQLCKELNEEKFKNQLLTRKLKEASQERIPFRSSKMFQGQKLNRSMSIA